MTVGSTFGQVAQAVKVMLITNPIKNVFMIKSYKDESCYFHHGKHTAYAIWLP